MTDALKLAAAAGSSALVSLNHPTTRDAYDQPAMQALAGYHLVDLTLFLLGSFEVIHTNLWKGKEPATPSMLETEATVLGRSGRTWLRIECWVGGKPDPSRDGKPMKYERILAVLATRGVYLRQRAIWTMVRTPADLERATRAPGGSIYGTSSNGARAAFLRAANISPIPGLYLVGGSAHPGGGLPLVGMSAEIVANVIGRDGETSQRT